MENIKKRINENMHSKKNIRFAITMAVIVGVIEFITTIWF